MNKNIFILPDKGKIQGIDNFLSFYESFNNLKEVEVNQKEVVEIKTVSVDVFLDSNSFEHKLIQSRASLEKLIHGFLELFTVCTHAVISFDNIKRDFGIKRLFVTETIPNQHGFVTNDTRVVLNKIRIWPSYKFEPLAGVYDIHHQLQEIFSSNLHKNHVTLQKILLIGPSGTGKPTLIRNLSLENNAFLFEISSNDVIGSLPGDTEAKLRQIFDKAKALTETFNDQISVIMIRNVELLCPKEIDSKDSAHVSRISSQMMSLLEKLGKGVVVVGVTSNIEAVDLRLRRPGRIDEEIYVRMPDVMQREEILKELLQEIISKNVEKISKDVAFQTNGFVGSDFALIVKHLTRITLKKDNKTPEEMVMEAVKKVTPSCMKGEFENRSTPNKSFDSIGGLETLKSTIRTSVLGPLRNPEAFKRFGLKPPSGILLYGPPGCSKTTIAQCIASETKMTFYSSSAAEIYSPYVGKAEKYLVKLFNQARISAPSIIFLDEIDSLVGSRSSSASNDVQSRILSTLLTEMDGIGNIKQTTAQVMSKQILVIAATNRPDMIDDALMRPGRFDKLIHVPAPDIEGRLAILNIVKNRIPFKKSIDFGELASDTEGFSGADLINLCNEAALVAATENLDAEIVTQENINVARSNVRPSLTEKQIECYYDFEKRVKAR